MNNARTGHVHGTCRARTGHATLTIRIGFKTLSPIVMLKFFLFLTTTLVIFVNEVVGFQDAAVQRREVNVYII